MEKSIGIVVVTYNRIALLKEVVESLRNQTCYSDCQIVVVNNGSTDETPQWLKQQDDIVTITQENLGGSGGFYTGMNYVASNGYEYCWIMDDDVICDNNALEELLKAYSVENNIGYVCSAVSGIDGSVMNVPEVDHSPSANGYPDYYRLIEHQMIKTKSATFVSVLFKVATIKEMGLPYKDYFIWGDDIEYTTRISKKYPSYLACTSKVLHKRKIQGAITFETEKDKKRLINYFYYFRNNINNKKLHDGFVSFLLSYLKFSLMAIKYFFTFDFRRYWILTKALFAVLFFKSKVEYPK